MGFNSVTIPSPGNGVAAGIMSKPLVFDQNALFGAPYDPGLNVVAGGGIQGAPALVDPNMGRPSRVLQWNISLQREVVRDLVVEAAFVGNHGVWESNGSSQGFSNASVGNLINYDAVSPAVLAAHGLGDLTDANTRSLLSSDHERGRGDCGFRNHTQFGFRLSTADLRPFRNTVVSVSSRRHWAFLV